MKYLFGSLLLIVTIMFLSCQNINSEGVINEAKLSNYNKKNIKKYEDVYNGDTKNGLGLTSQEIKYLTRKNIVSKEKFEPLSFEDKVLYYCIADEFLCQKNDKYYNPYRHLKKIIHDDRAKNILIKLFKSNASMPIKKNALFLLHLTNVVQYIKKNKNPDRDIFGIICHTYLSPKQPINTRFDAFLYYSNIIDKYEINNKYKLNDSVQRKAAIATNNIFFILEVDTFLLQYGNKASLINVVQHLQFLENFAKYSKLPFAPDMLERVTDTLINKIKDMPSLPKAQARIWLKKNVNRLKWNSKIGKWYFL